VKSNLLSKPTAELMQATLITNFPIDVPATDPAALPCMSLEDVTENVRCSIHSPDLVARGLKP
jgi:hypothetical protein